MLAGSVAVVVPVAVLAGWAVTGWTVPDRATEAGRDAWVHRGEADVVPAVAAAEAEGPGATRTLVLRVQVPPAGTGQAAPQLVSWALERFAGPRTGATSAVSTASTASTTGSRAGDDELLGVISGLLSDAGADERDALADRGIGSVLLLSPAAGSDATSALDTAPGLVRVATHRGSVLWRVEMTGDGGPTRPARVRLLGPDGGTVATIGSTTDSAGNGASGRIVASSQPRTLVLAERADPGWTATLAGRRLEPVGHAGWAQGFRVPAGAGGAVRVGYQDGLPSGSGPAWVLIAGLALLVAVPMPRRRRRPAPRQLPTLAAEPVALVGRRRMPDDDGPEPQLPRDHARTDGPDEEKP